MALQNSNQYTIEKPTDQLITEHEQTTSTNTTSAATTAAEVKDNEQVKPVSPASESDEQSEEDQPTMDDIGEEEHSADVWDGGSSNTESNDNGTDDFFEDNKELLKKIKNILDFVYPNSKISLAELLTSVKEYVIKYAQNLGGGGDNDDADPKLPPEGDDVTAPIEPGADGETVKPSEEDKINELIAKGFCKIYNTSLDEFSKVVNAELFGNDIYGFECKKSDDQKEIANAVNIDRYNAEFDKQDNVRIDQLYKAVNAIVDELKNNMPNDQYNAKTIIAPIANYCQNNDTVVLNYISYLLKVFYDKWLLPDGSGDRFPYVIDGGDDVKRKESISAIKTEWDKVKKGIAEIEKGYNNDKNIRTIKLPNDPTPYTVSGYTKYLTKEDYDKLSKEKKKNYKGPTNYIIDDKTITSVYMGDKGDGDLFVIDKNDKKYYYHNNRNDIKWFDKSGKNEEFDLQLYYGGSTSSNCQAGKGCPQMMKDVADKLLESYNGTLKELEEEFSKKYAKVYSANNSKYRFKDYLHDLGIGMDCSGYVSRALAFIMTNLRVPGHIQLETLGPGYGRIKSNATTLSRVSKEHSSLIMDTKPRPKGEDSIWKDYVEKIIPNIQPGDIEMVGETGNGFHIRIIYSVDTKNMCFIDHQSGTQNAYLELKQKNSSLRFGVEETVVSKDKNLGKYLDNYRFARPNVFKDPERLRGFFIDMLKYKGGST